MARFWRRGGHRIGRTGYSLHPEAGEAIRKIPRRDPEEILAVLKGRMGGIKSGRVKGLDEELASGQAGLVVEALRGVDPGFMAKIVGIYYKKASEDPRLGPAYAEDFLRRLHEFNILSKRGYDERDR